MSRTLLFLATEDWFVRSHFAHLLQRAREEGYDVTVAARMSGALDDAGVRLIDLPIQRASTLSMWREAEAVRDLVQREAPTLVHAIALRPIAALLLAPARPTVFAVTGRGYLSVQPSPIARTTLMLMAAGLRDRVKNGSGALLVENEADVAWVSGSGAPLLPERVVLSPGAGVDISRYSVAPEPSEPVVVGVASRLVRSKGIDVAVAAIAEMRRQGADVRLRIAGAPDDGNPDQVTEDELTRWRATEGVELLGHVADVNAFWADAHIACLPSRGGEGLPKSLLEAAACGRPIVTTDTPGCADLVRRGDIGLIAPPNDAEALARALQAMAQDAVMRRRLGAAARAQVEAHYTLRHAADAAAQAWRAAGARA